MNMHFALFFVSRLSEIALIKLMCSSEHKHNILLNNVVPSNQSTLRNPLTYIAHPRSPFLTDFVVCLAQQRMY